VARKRSPKPYPNPLSLLRELQYCLGPLYQGSRAAEWGLDRKAFLAALERSVTKRFGEEPATRERLEEYLGTVHIDDLVLASACMEGSETAWEFFVGTYRGYLRASAGAITKGSASGTDAQELADSLFAELFGLVDGKRGEASLFRYFHGRSSLKTWLRTVLAQRHVDRLRGSRRWEPLEREDGKERPLAQGDTFATAPADPHHEEYLQRFLVALTLCLDALDPGDRQRLELYYARQKTLAEIGRLLGEHESSASRNLERVRRELRAKVEEHLRVVRPAGDDSPALPPMSEAQIALCFQYAAEDAPIDFRKIFPGEAVSRPEPGRKESS
jgi:RNA polymerase sigma factor (sigma-70 family)